MMNPSLDFWLNDAPIRTGTARGTPLLDFLRGGQGLSGTKEGCREGDCGACAVLIGTSGAPGSPDADVSGAVRYRAVPSCLFALGEAEGSHILTIEGLASGAPDGLTPVMRAFLEENASQCGFCSPGFIVALSAWLAQPGPAPDMAGAMAAIDGNLCRCTGYGAIRRAAARLCREFADLPSEAGPRLAALVEAHVLPRSTLEFSAQSSTAPAIASAAGADAAPGTTAPGTTTPGATVLGGGTDYYVRNPDPEPGFAPALLARMPGYAGIARSADGSHLIVGAATRVTDFFASAELRQAVPGIERFERLFASTLIRNLATLGGNLANASPVGDLTAMLMALGATLEIAGTDGADGMRLVPIERFHTAYKKTALRDREAIRSIRLPIGPHRFSFEKASKRANLDIAAVNSALAFRLADGAISGARLSAGGAAPVPLLLSKASALLEGARADAGPQALAALARAVAATAEKEISPISDVRGSAEYRRRMTGRFVLAHFLRLFPDSGLAEELFP